MAKPKIDPWKLGVLEEIVAATTTKEEVLSDRNDWIQLIKQVENLE